MSTSLMPVQSSSNKVLCPDPEANRDAYSRLGLYIAWLDQRDIPWFRPDLAAYRDHLLGRLQPSSVQAHLGTIRAQYRRLLMQRERFYELLPDDILALPFHDRKPYVDELVLRLEAALSPFHAPVKVITQQDVADSQHLRLTQSQAEALMRRPFDVHGNQHPLAWRDASLIALMLATGIREGEACNLAVEDLRQQLGGTLALLVREGKGSKQRLVPYGANNGVLGVVESWLERGGISEGRVFRSFTSRACTGLRGSLTTRSLQNVLASYPIYLDGHLRAVQPHDLRRTYARREYEAGTDIIAIQQNLGHSNLETTMGYIGTLDTEKRQGRAAYDWQGLIITF